MSEEVIYVEGNLSRAHEGDAAYDLSTTESIRMLPGAWAMIDVGISRIAIPKGYAALVIPRSGKSLQGLTVMNSPGLIDSGYRSDPVKVIAHNESNRNKSITEGERIAQIMFIKVADLPIQYSDSDEHFAPVDDRNGGFGSSGE